MAQVSEKSPAHSLSKVALRHCLALASSALVVFRFHFEAPTKDCTGSSECQSSSSCTRPADSELDRNSLEEKVEANWNPTLEPAYSESRISEAALERLQSGSSLVRPTWLMNHDHEEQANHSTRAINQLWRRLAREVLARLGQKCQSRRPPSTLRLERLAIEDQTRERFLLYLNSSSARTKIRLLSRPTSTPDQTLGQLAT